MLLAYRFHRGLEQREVRNRCEKVANGIGGELVSGFERLRARPVFERPSGHVLEARRGQSDLH